WLQLLVWKEVAKLPTPPGFLKLPRGVGKSSTVLSKNLIPFRDFRDQRGKRLTQPARPLPQPFVEGRFLGLLVPVLLPGVQNRPESLALQANSALVRQKIGLGQLPLVAQGNHPAVHRRRPQRLHHVARQRRTTWTILVQPAQVDLHPLRLTARHH